MHAALKAAALSDSLRGNIRTDQVAAMVSEMTTLQADQSAGTLPGTAQ